MHIKIFVDNKPLYISDGNDVDLKKIPADKGAIFLKDEEPDVAALLKDLQAEENTSAVILTKDIAAAKKHFFSFFKQITAAGGIVQNEKKDLLFIFRRGKWDLPKGKMEKGEDPETCAGREIEEETGVKNLTLKRKIGETYHIYREKGKNYLKTNHWFYFISTGKQHTAPQAEEDITEVRWITTRKIKEPMNKTYQSIREIMRIFFDEP